MQYIKKHLYPCMLFLLLTGLYFFTRIYNLTGLPIFTDEAIYIRWSQIALQDPSWIFISLTDGKQPMYVWIAIVFLNFISDPLLAGRLVSVLSGFLAAIGLFLLTREVFKNKKIALLSSLLYILFPFALVYDRIALYDSLVGMFAIWSLYFEILLVKHLKLKLAIILGIIIGLGMLTKTSANFALILLPLSLLLFNFKTQNYKKKFLRWILLILTSSILANLIYSILRLSPLFYIIEQKNYVFIYSPKEFLQHPYPFESFFNNLYTFSNWFIDYATIPFLILIIASFFINKKYTKEKLLFFSWFIIPLVSTALFGRLVYPRYMLFMVLPLIVLAAYTIYTLMTKLKNIWLKIFIFFIFIFMFLIKDYYIITDFKKAPIPQSDRGQFITGWPSGAGVAESIKILQKEAKNKKIFVGTQGTFGLMPHSLEIYLSNNPNIKIVGYYPGDKKWPNAETPPEEVISISKKIPTYFIFYQECPACSSIGIAPASWPVKQMFQIEKEEKGQFYTLYKIEP